MLIRRLFVVTVCILLVAALFAGCGSKTGDTGNKDNTSGSRPSQEETKKDSAQKVKIRFALAMDPARLEIYKTSVDRFNKQHAGIEVVIENTPWTEYWQKLQAQTATNTMPDVWNYVPGFGQEWLEKDLLLPLDDLIKDDPGINIKDFVPGMLDYMRKDSKLYGLPYDVSGAILYYNKDLFDKAKVSYPTDQWTFEDARKAAVAITGKVEKYNGGKVYGFGSYPIDNWMAAGYFKAWGGDYVTRELEVKIDSPGSVKALQFWLDLGVKDKVMPPVDEAYVNSAQGFVSWLNGRAAMLFDGPWAIPNYTSNCKFNWDIVRVPAGPVSRSPVLLGGTFVIDSHTKHSAESWEFLKYITGKEQLEEIVAKPGAGIPARISAGEVMSPMMKKAAAYISESESFVAIQGFFDISDVQKKEFELLWLGQKTAEDAAREVAGKAREIIKGKYSK